MAKLARWIGFLVGAFQFDLFAGSGAQLVAAEQTGATCYAAEWEPLYVAIALQRLADMGLSPKLVKS